MFKRKKNKDEDHSSIVTTDLCQRPFGSIGPVGYTHFPPLYDELYKKLNKWLEALMKGELTEKNHDMLDSLIIDFIRPALDDLSDQYIHHVETINHIANRNFTDPKYFENAIQETTEDLEIHQKRFDELYALIQNQKWRKPHEKKNRK